MKKSSASLTRRAPMRKKRSAKSSHGVHGDYCTVRRMFIGMGWTQRENGGCTVNPNPDESGF